MKPDRKHSIQLVPFDLSVAADFARWQSLLVDGADLSKFQEGARIYDSLTTLCLELRQAPSGLRWRSRGGLVCQYVATEDLPPCRWVVPLNDGSNQWRVCNTDGEGNPGISLAPAKAGELVYVIEQGSYLVEAGPFPFNLPTALGTDAQGRARPLSAVGEFYAGYNTDFVTIDAVNFLVSNIGMTILVV